MSETQPPTQSSLPPQPTTKPTSPPPKKQRQKRVKPSATPPPPAPSPSRTHILPYPPPYLMNHYGPPYHQPYPPPQQPQQHQQQQYSYPIPYYPPGPYQYPPHMMMYQQQPPRTDPPQNTPSPSQVPSNLKRKRKSTDTRKGDNRSDDEGTSGSDARHPSQQSVVDIKKRTKTQRACDSCRSRKIRCDILADMDPPVCQHCKQYGFECTFFLPITETRFRKKKQEEESAAAAVAAKDSDSKPSASKSDSQTSFYGPTSAEHLLHSQASISSRIYESYDARYNHAFEVSKTGDGLITVHRPTIEEANQQIHPKPLDLRIERETIEQLVNAYFTDVAPILPVITQAEFLANPNPAPVLVYAMCLVAAARRQVPQAIFDSIRYAVNNVIKMDDVLSTATIANVQALLILCMMGDCHSQFVPNALSALWIRLGTAIRMAQDLGLHRAESVNQNIELRRRLWGACLISDRWTSLTYGHPYMIDVQDCDARLPSSGDPNDLYMDELVRLSVILGRVLKTIYSPSGLAFATDEQLSNLLNDIEAWKAGLPEQLWFRGPETHRTAGLLHLLYSCVCMMFWRVFMRISYSCPAHLKFGLTVEQWSRLVQLTGESIDWLEANDQVYDVWLLVAYAATSCALVQTAEIIALLYEATQGPHPTLMEPPPLNPTGGVTVKMPVSGLDYKKDPTRPGGGVFVASGQAAREGDFQGVPAGVVISSSEAGGNENGVTNPGEVGQVSPPSVSSPMTALNERDRASATFSTSSPFAPPLPGDNQQRLQQQQQQQQLTSSPNVPPAHRGLSMSSAIRSTATTATANQGMPPGSPGASPIVNFTPLGRRQNAYASTNLNPNMHQQPQAGNVQVMNVLDGPQGGNQLQEFAMTDNEFLNGIPGSMFDWGQWDTFFQRFTGSNGAAAAAAAAAASANGMGPFQGPRAPPLP
ncbi:hypothetical protein H0H93_013842 [Arthromyces matolae]|nr:hypothetical protein H0H93_013842 [Arthromyces matolae]